MDIGLNLPVMVPGFDRATLLEWAKRIDTGPFSTISAGERVFFPNPEIIVALSAAAAVTKRAKIKTDVVVLPMHDPIHVAKQIASLDVLSNGRVVLGVGVGGRDEDYRGYGATFDKTRLRRLEAGVATMRRAWAGEDVTGALRPLEPKPLQAGGPPILIGAISDLSIRRAAKWADGLSFFSFGPSRADVEHAFDLARREWKAAGRDREPTLVVGCWYGLGPDARAQLDEYLLRYLAFMGKETAEMLAPMVATDSKEKLRDVVAMSRDLGADELLLVPTTSDPDEVHRVADAVGS